MYLVKVVTLLPKKRNRLTEDSIMMIVCLKAWGIYVDEEVDGDTSDIDA